MEEGTPESLEEKQKASKSMMTNLSQDVDALRDTILRLSDRLEQLKTPSPSKGDTTNAPSTAPRSSTVPTLSVAISDPQNHEDSFGSHTSYKVSTKVHSNRFLFLFDEG